MAEKPKSKDAPKLPDTTPVTSQPTNEQAVTTSTPKFVRKSTVAVTSPTSEEQMLAAYDIGDTGFDPELDGTGNDVILESEKPAETTDSEKPAETKERFDQLNDYPVGKTAEGEVEQATEAPKSKHPEWLTAMAVKAGIKPSTIERVDSDSLGELIAEYNELRKAPEQRREKEPEPEEEDDLGDLAESLDPRMLKRLNEAKELKKRLAGLEQKLNMQEKTVQQQREEQAYAEIDNAFDEASEKMNGMFGKGRSSTLSPSSPILERRKLIMAAAKLVSDKDPSKPLKQCINDAITMLYPRQEKKQDVKSEVKKTVNGAPRITEEMWDGGTLAKPTQRHSEAPNGTQKATQNLARRMKEMDLPDEQDDDEVMAGFIG